MFEVHVSDNPAVAEARRRAVASSAKVGFGPERQSELALVVTELCTNLVKHGGGGRLLVDESDRRIVLLALDRGPGIHDLKACLADGFSTAGTPGNGLGAVRRAAQAVSFASWPDRGTAVFARVDASDAPPPQDDIAAVVVPKGGEVACGDAWAWRDADAGRTVFVVDGLGHGTDAAIAANEALRIFHRSYQGTPAEIIDAVHQGLRHTRGGAVAVARADQQAGTILFAGLGNIASSIVGADGRVRRMVSHNGTAGHNARKIQTFEYPGASGTLVMHSDGISSSWSVNAYPDVLASHPSLVAGVLYRDFGRARDDATVVVARVASR